MVGGCGGYFKTGRALDFNKLYPNGAPGLGLISYDGGPGTGVPNNGLLIALANAMGVPTTSFGYSKYSIGEINELSTA
jgi:hypothetical protein